MSMSIPFAFEVKDRGQLDWSVILPKFLYKHKLQHEATVYSSWCPDGHIICQQLHLENTVAWVHHFLTDSGEHELKMQVPKDHLLLCFLLSGSVGFKSPNGEVQIHAAQWHLISNTENSMRLLLNENAQVLWLLIPSHQLSGYQKTFPDVMQWLSLKPTDESPIGKTRVEVFAQIYRMVGTTTLEAQTILAAKLWELIDSLLMKSFEQISSYLLNSHCHSYMAHSRIETVNLVKSQLLDGIFNLTSPSLAKLSHLAGVCPRSLQLVFKEVYKCSMTEYFLSARMESMARRIMAPYKSLQEIAFEYNYQDYSTFSGAISRWWGVPPSSMRKSGMALTPPNIKKIRLADHYSKIHQCAAS